MAVAVVRIAQNAYLRLPAAALQSQRSALYYNRKDPIPPLSTT